MIDWLFNVLTEIWLLGLEMAPYIIVGLVAAVFVYALFPRDKIQRVLGRPGWGSTVKAALIGIPLPLCSCGVLPTAMSLKKRGASSGATVSFLVSTPETGLDSMAVTYALINPLMTVLRPVAAFISAVLTGAAVDRFSPGKNGAAEDATVACLVCGEQGCSTRHPATARVRASAHYIMFDFFPDIANWLVLGLVLSGVLAAVLPADLFVGSSSLLQMVLVVTAGIPMYICASASTPIAAVLLAKGMAPGAALVFLLVGPATNIASLLVVGRLLGRRTAAVYLIALVVSSIAIGVLVDAFLGGLDWTPRIAEQAMHEHISLFKWLGLILLTLAILHTWKLKATAFMRKRQTASSAALGTPAL